MDKQSLVRLLQQSVDGAVTMNMVQIARATGKSKNKIPEMMAGVDYWKDGRQKKYSVSDVAQVIMDRRVRSA